MMDSNNNMILFIDMPGTEPMAYYCTLYYVIQPEDTSYPANESADDGA
jgi:hypothetical protein